MLIFTVNSDRTGLFFLYVFEASQIIIKSYINWLFFGINEEIISALMTLMNMMNLKCKNIVVLFVVNAGDGRAVRLCKEVV